MEPTAQSSRHPDFRTPPSTPRNESAAIEPLGSWDGPGTAYTVIPRPPIAAAPTVQAVEPVPDYVLPTIATSAAKPAVNWPLVGGVAFGTLLTALLIALWQPWAIDHAVDLPASQATSASPLPEAQRTDNQVAATAPATREPADYAPLLLPPSAPMPKAPLTAPAETTASAPLALPPTVDATVQAPPVQAQKRPIHTTPASPPVKAHPVHAPVATRPAAKPTRPASVANPPAAAATGTLVVAVQPWAEVWIDGSKRGISPPLFKLQLPPGTYAVELRNPALPGYSQKLQIVPGQTVTLRHSFQ